MPSPASLTSDQRKLLYLISLFLPDKRGENVSWLKIQTLRSLIYYLTVRHILEGVDYAPTLSFWGNMIRYVNISQEAERDISTLVEEGYLSRLRLATVQYRFLFAYRLTRKGATLVGKMNGSEKEEVRGAFSCPNCGELMQVEFNGANPYLICEKCGHSPLVCPECETDMEYIVKDEELYRNCKNCGLEIKGGEESVSGVIWNIEDISYKTKPLF